MLYCHAIRIEEHEGNIPEAMNAIFHEHIRKIVECYVDDIAVKSCTKGSHIADQKTLFDIMQAHQLKMNSTNPSWG